MNCISIIFDCFLGIVYCFSRKDCEDVARGLSERGIASHCYHSDLDAKLKSNIHQRWSNGKLQVIYNQSVTLGGLSLKFKLYHKSTFDQTNLVKARFYVRSSYLPNPL